MIKSTLVLIILLFLFQGIACAEFYKWEDENGNVVITDYPPPAKSAKKIRIHKPEPESGNSLPSTGEKAPKVSSGDKDVKSKKSHEVILYVTSWCPYCKKAKDFFDSRNISYTEYDVEKDRDAAARKKQLDPRGGVPFAIVNGQQIHGYSPSAYESALQ